MPEPMPPVPDFSDGTEFLLDLRRELHRRGRRRVALSSMGSVISMGLLFLLSFTHLQEQRLEDSWEAYLLSQAGEELVLDAEDEDLAWDLYFEGLMSMEELDELLEAVLEMETGTEIIQSINLEG